MRLLVVIGAGASYDSWPEHVKNKDHWEKLPLANDLFAPLPTQDSYLKRFQLMGLSSKLRRKSIVSGKNFDIENELEVINETANKRRDLNTLQDLFKARFYIHSLILQLSKKTLDYTSGHTVYVDLISQLKDWIDAKPSERYVDVVVFNYDTLIEDAMENVYPHDWYSKNNSNPLAAYYTGKNLRIFKPHGSINWARKVTKNDKRFFYNRPDQAVHDFNQISIEDSFDFVDPSIFLIPEHSKDYIPSIAVPFKGKTHFDECPRDMHDSMVQSMRDADKMVTLGWKGADEHFTSLLRQVNDRIDEINVISPSATTQLSTLFPSELIRPWESSFRHFVSDSPALENLLKEFK